MLKEAWKYYKKVFLNLNDHDVDENMMKQLCDLINDNKGECEVWIKVNNNNETKKFRSRTMKINPDSDTTSTFGNLPGTNKWNAGVVASKARSPLRSRGS